MPRAIRNPCRPAGGRAGCGQHRKYFVYVGGQYFSLDDVPGTSTPNSFATQTQTIYGIVDDTSVVSPALPNIRSTGGTCPSSGGNGDFVCRRRPQNAGGYHGQPQCNGPQQPQRLLPRHPDFRRARQYPAGGDARRHAGGGGEQAVQRRLQPGGSNLFQLSATTGGAIVKNYGGSEYYPSIFFIGDALSSRPVIVTMRPAGLLRLSDKTTQSREIFETAGSAPAFRRIYMRPLH